MIHSKQAHLFFQSIKERGVPGTILVLFSYVVDFLFDLKYGTDTFSSVEVADLGVVNASTEHAEQYQLTHTLPLRKVLTALKIPPGRILVDLGCGKGKVLLTASEFGFKEARGIEFSPLLCDIARRNCSTYKNRTNTRTDFGIINSDVLDYGMKDDEDVFFLFNPFDGYILEQVLKNISDSLLRRKRKIWIIYNNAVHRELFDRWIKPTSILNFTFWGDEYAVFEAG